MSHWNYRVIKKQCKKTGEVYFQIHEVYYNNAGEIIGVTKNAAAPLGDDEEDLQGELALINIALDRPVLTLDEIEYGVPDWSLGHACLDDFIFGSDIESYRDVMPKQCQEAIGKQPELGIGWSKEHHWFVADTKGLDPQGLHQKNSFMVTWSERQYEENDDILCDMLPYRIWVRVCDEMPRECREVVEACVDGDDSVAGRGIGWNEELGWFVTEVFDVQPVVIWSEKGEPENGQKGTRQVP